jgi:valyl-tRNA synthetase
MAVGRKLATKLLNVSKFVLSFPADGDTASHDLDRAMLARLADVIDDATAAFEVFDYARALERTESFFWWFCDDYVELVKSRAYGDTTDSPSARFALRRALSVLQRLFAPHLPFCTDEVWSWWHGESVHLAEWPSTTDVATFSGDHESLLNGVCEVLARVRRTKTEAKVSQRAAVTSVTVTGPESLVSAVNICRDDLMKTGSVGELVVSVGDAVTVDVVLAPAD